MNELKTYTLLCLLLAIVLGMFMAKTSIDRINHENLKKEAIQLNHAEYNRTNGNWQWITNSVNTNAVNSEKL